MVISKELFVKAINELQRANDYQDMLNEFYAKNACDGYLIQPDCSDMLIRVLETAMDVEENEEGYSDLYYFCYELDFGRKFNAGDVTERDHDGNEVELDFSSAESLYDYLVGKENENETNKETER